MIEIIKNLPQTWYPALIIEMVGTAYKKDVFVPGQASSFVAQNEERWEKNDIYKMSLKSKGDPEFDSTGLPKLRACPRCGGTLKYWSVNFAACTSRVCAFSQIIR